MDKIKLQNAEQGGSRFMATSQQPAPNLLRGAPSGILRDGVGFQPKIPLGRAACPFNDWVIFQPNETKK